MAIPKYYVRPDGLHETIIRINGKRKAFRGKTDREVWNKVKEYRDDLAAGRRSGCWKPCAAPPPGGRCFPSPTGRARRRV